eukprot:362295-Chlamydomonas_euryale.AAC.3
MPDIATGPVWPTSCTKTSASHFARSTYADRAHKNVSQFACSTCAQCAHTVQQHLCGVRCGCGHTRARPRACARTDMHTHVHKDTHR